MYKVTFNNKNKVFFNALKANVDQYFIDNNIRKTGNWKLYLKSAVLIPAAILIYLSLLLLPLNLFTGILLSGLFGFTLASIGFNIMHDACHGSYSTRKWVNDLFGLSMNALGGNAFLWKLKHNIVHHTYTNIDGIDDDINNMPFMRECSTQPWKPIHRYQQFYMFFLYGFTSLFLLFITDYIKYVTRKVYTTPLKPMDIQEHLTFWISKLLYIAITIVIPILVLGWQPWLLGFLVMHFVLGLTLAVVFQLAHVVEHAEFEVAGIEPKKIENEWAIHQVKTTANFAANNKFLSWLVGGLNFQIEHHLFPRISHVHYPAISKIVQQTCQQFGLQYIYYPSLGAAVASHYRFMKQLGQKP
ncbi:acyl-CoA desaturase [Agriterribacter sp.]|uniref:fatty acid desaturase family protein n=1 Tax=Agriterribacter sp. TaxID=2821509 RepID=UPI002C5469B9|nr:acyl-CoA desaturase [Agriterribacter sp.]HRO44906.1 acyl-CoA desaturase [Agriterribacter sp.]HRQ15644.1 acyl-CoA desaturase [Agriterribacter sp.]